MKCLSIIVSFVAVFSAVIFAQSNEINIIPKPQFVQKGEGVFGLNRNTRIVVPKKRDRRTAAQTRDYTRWVNPFIGTGGHGHTFPGAVVPFGMVQLSPDTRIDNWDGSSGYHYSDDIIYGFSHTHLSGTGIPDGCDILFMPTVGEPQFFAKEGDKSVNGYASRFSHAREKAEPGYYAVKLEDDGIYAELTATKRVGFHRYTFPSAGDANLVLDLVWRDRSGINELNINGKRFDGYRRSSSWAKNQTVYFAGEFSEYFTAPYWGPDATFPKGSRAWLNTTIGEEIRGAFPFGKLKNRQVLVKVAISFVSIEGARKNLEAELPHWDFDRVRAEAKAAWNRELSKVQVSGGTPDQMTNFYTALYHTMIHPSIFSDVDGKYRGMDGKIHQLERNADTPVRNEREARKKRDATSGISDNGVRVPSEHYTVFSLWDTFRATHPLYTIIDQKRTVDFINTFIRQYEQGGRLPVWELWGEETDTMIGYHAVSVIADAMAKGIKGFDYEKAYAAAKHSAELDHFGLAAYKTRGYISIEDENESVSRTLEYAYNDWCIAQMARLLGKIDDAQRFDQRARYFENLFDARTGFFRPKKNGGFVEPFAPNEVTFGFTEGNSWQYSFFVPHDVNRLIELMGGREKFVAKLDELFTTDQKLAGREQPDITGLIGQYAHGNEPSHHIAYLYNYAGEPWKTQKYVRRIMDNFYKNAPDGLIGNEDCGQMSAWYILSASGFYPVAPGQASYTLGAPLFTQIIYKLENGNTFAIRSPRRNGTDSYLKPARLNGKPFNSNYLSHEVIMAGGVLEFEPAKIPAKTIFLPLYQRDQTGFVAVPLIEGVRRVFHEKTTITLSAAANASIFYTTDGSEPTDKSARYSAPFTIHNTTTIKAIAVNASGDKSLVAEAKFYKKPNDWTVTIASKYSRQYTGGGDEALIDGIRGTTNFASGEWQGYQGQDFVAVIDMGVERDFTEVGGNFLQVAGSWIWMPTKIEIEAMLNGESYEKIAEIITDVPVTEMTPTIREFKASGPTLRARYVKFTARNLGKIPSWHPGAGFEAFIFVDEIFVR